jgi:serine/threonine protein kinase/peptidoglycan hydrolase-like protein with peptidoglycan-binding domain
MRLRSYELVDVLGQGAFGITYLARDVTLGRQVAIKEYLPTSVAFRDGDVMVVARSTALADEFVWGRERFLDEARTLATLEGTPAVVRVIDYLEANGTAYTVMVLAPGETLDRRLRAGSLPATAIDALLDPLLIGLEQVHALGFLHRDIKPANIIVDSRFHPTLIDFGAARAAMVGRSTALTAIFTPGYAAVEQFTASRQGPWTDIYGLAATLHHAIIGRPPPSAVDRMLDDSYEPLARLRLAGFAPALLAAIDSGLAVRAQDRPQSIAQWRALLSGSGLRNDVPTVVLAPARRADALGETPAHALAAAALPAARKRHLNPWWAAGAAAALLLGGGTYLALAPKSTPSIQDLQTLKTEDFERLLAERRAADAAAAETKRLEEEAQRKVEADAEAKRKADAELEKAKQDRQKAEAALAKMKADMEGRQKAEAADQQQRAASEARRTAEEEAQGKAEAEMAALRQAEEEAKQKALAEAEKKRQADEALTRAQAQRQEADEAAAARRRAENEAAAMQKAEADARQKAAEAKQKADAEAAEKVAAEAARKQKAKTEDAEKKAAEAAETALRLAPADRQRLQVALISQGFDTRGTDGAFGPRSREMIASWQKARNQPATGFLTASQQQSLLQEAAAAVAKHDEAQKVEDDKKEAERKKAEDDKKKADEEAKRKVEGAANQAAPAPQTAAVAPAAPARPTPPATAVPAPTLSFDGQWQGTGRCGSGSYTVNVSVTNGSLRGIAAVFGTKSGYAATTITFSGTIEPSSGAAGINDPNSPNARYNGKFNGNRLVISGWSGEGNCQFQLEKK